MATSKIERPWQSLFPDFPLTQGAGFHNSIWRGISLGNSLTSTQSAVIVDGTFTDLFLGDYWTINDVNWRIMAFDYFYRTGVNNFTKHHIIIVPDTSLYNCKWNTTSDTVTGGIDNGAGYINSFIRSNIKSDTNGKAEGAEKKVIAAFGDSHVLSFTEIYPSTYDEDGNATAYAAVSNCRVELMSEIMIYGTQVFTGNGRGNGYEVGTEKFQLPGFSKSPSSSRGVDVWLRNLHTKTKACVAGALGNASMRAASYALGVRPFALIA